MARKLPPESFDYYSNLGPGRSYLQVAQKYGVTKRAVVMRAKKERWQERVESIERKARQARDEKNIEALESINQRHLKIARAVQAKAIEALKAMPLRTAMDAIRALDIGVRQERLLLGLEAPEATEDPAEATSLIAKWCAEAPRWQTEVLAATLQWGEGDPRASRLISDLLQEICRWLDSLSARGAVDPALRFQELLLEAFRVEENPTRRSRMREMLFRLEAALEAFRTDHQIEPGDLGKWEIAGEENLGARGFEGKEGQGTHLAEDPITLVARTLREATEEVK